MATQKRRGSDKLLEAWKRRALTDESVGEISEALSKSPATMQGASVFGGANASGLRVALRYEGDDVAWCGNDIVFWLRWHLKYGGIVRPPKFIINGTPYPDLVHLQLDFGRGDGPAPALGDPSGSIGGLGGVGFGG